MRVGILMGGQSPEHDVSLRSAGEILRAIDRKKYTPVPIFIDRKGRWHLESGEEVVDLRPHIDVAFPVLHGPFGEDGTVQGFLLCQGIPCVGSGVLGMAVSMDKDVTKRLLRDAGLPVARFATLYEPGPVDLRYPLFVKPANGGSSIGISMAASEEELAAALDLAFLYDKKVVVEEGIVGRELEIAVLDGEVSCIGEVVPKGPFYSHEIKSDDSLVELHYPVEMEQGAELAAMAQKVFAVLSLSGMARVDFFLTPEGKLYVNEANAIPGFTRSSLYPRLFEASGVPMTELIDRLIGSATRVLQPAADDLLKPPVGALD